MNRSLVLVCGVVLSVACQTVVFADDDAKFNFSAEADRAFGTNSRTTVLGREELNLSAEKGIEECRGKISGRLRRDADLGEHTFGEAAIRNASVTCRHESWLVSAGRQSVVWGKADGFPVLDVVHPFDYREFILDDREEARRPLAMLRMEKQIESDNYAQFLVIPEKRSDILPEPGARFSEPWGNQVKLADTVGVDQYGENVHFNKPELGLQWENASSDIGWTANLLRRWAPQPYFNFNPASYALQGVDYQQWVIGGSFDLSVSDWVLRGEAIHVPRVFLSTKPSQVDYRPYQQSSWMVGADKNIGEWLLGIQFFQTLFFGGEIEPLQGRRQDTLTLMAARSFWQDRVKVRGFVAHDASHIGNWYRTQASWQAYDDIKFLLQADIFNGRGNATFGQLEKESRIKLGARVDF